MPLACTHPDWSNLDPTTGKLSPGHATAPLHTGPDSGCTVTRTLTHSDTLQYYCFVTNGAGHTWTHVAVAGTGITGWVWDEYLDDFGSKYEC